MAPKKNESSAFQGPLLFVNHDAKHMKALPNRQKVFTHVQSNYRKWKRLENAKELRASAKIPRVETISIIEPEFHAPPKAGNALRRSHSSSTEPESIDSSQADYSSATDVEEIRRDPTPLSILKKGNSDPFGVYPVHVNPLVNNIITFYRDYVITSMYHIESRKWVTSASAVRDFRDSVDGLQDEGSAYGFLARYTSIASASDPSLLSRATEYRNKSTELLRAKVASGQSLQHDLTYWHINMLFAAETIDNNLPGALAHGSMLRHMFIEQSKTGKVDYKLLLYVVYNDCQMSSMFMTRPVFDVDGWLAKVLAPLWAAAEKQLPRLSGNADLVDPSVDDEELRSCFVTRRMTMEVWLLNATNQMVQTPLIMPWLMSRAFVSNGRMVNHYLNMVEHGRQSQAVDADLDQIYVQQYLSLAAIHWTRRLTFDLTVCGIPVFNAGPGILRLLRSALERSERHYDHPAWFKYLNARLFALYVGASAEHAAALRAPGSSNPYKLWFNITLADHALSMNLLKWEACRDILRGFFYSDMSQPHLSQWFEPLLASRSGSHDMPSRAHHSAVLSGFVPD